MPLIRRSLPEFLLCTQTNSRWSRMFSFEKTCSPDFVPLDNGDPPILVVPYTSACTHEGRRPYRLPCALDLLLVVRSNMLC